MVQLLNRNDNDVTLGSFTLGSSLDASVITKSNMDDTTLVRSHWTKLNASMSRSRLLCGRASKGLKLLTLTALIPFNIDNDRVTETNDANRNDGNQELESIKGTTMTTNKNRKIVASDIKDELTVVAFILVDGDLTNIEVFKDVLQCRNCSVGNEIKFFIRQRLISRVSLLIQNLIIDFKFFRHDKLLIGK